MLIMKSSFYFLKFYHSFFWPNLVPQSEILQTVILLRDILLYLIAVLMFIFSKCLPFNFSGKFGLKMLLQLSQNIAAIVAS